MNKKTLQKNKKVFIGLIIGLFFLASFSYAANTPERGLLGDLFEKVTRGTPEKNGFAENGKKVGTFRLIGQNIKDKTVTKNELAKDSIIKRHFKDESVTTVKIKDKAVRKSKLADGIVSTRTIQNRTIEDGKFNTGSVTTEKIKDGTIKAEDIYYSVSFSGSTHAITADTCESSTGTRIGGVTITTILDNEDDKIPTNSAIDEYITKTLSGALNCKGTNMGLQYYDNSFHCKDFTTYIQENTPINGECGKDLNECISGTFQDMADSDTEFKWTCEGINGGGNQNCSKIEKVTIDSGCVYSWRLSWPQSGPCIQPAETCSTANKGVVTEGVTCSWKCREDCTQKINGECGITENTCKTGTVKDFPDSDTELKWSCEGVNGGSNKECSILKPILVDGVCSTTKAYECLVGKSRENKKVHVTFDGQNTQIFNWFCGNREYCELRDTDGIIEKPDYKSTNGKCGQTTYTCETGLFTDIPNTTTEYKWGCLGIKLGSDDIGCSKPKLDSGGPGGCTVQDRYLTKKDCERVEICINVRANKYYYILNQAGSQIDLGSEINGGVYKDKDTCMENL